MFCYKQNWILSKLSRLHCKNRDRQAVDVLLESTHIHLPYPDPNHIPARLVPLVAQARRSVNTSEARPPKKPRQQHQHDDKYRH